MSGEPGHILLLLDGEAPSAELILPLREAANYIAVTDGAARAAKKLGLDLDLVIGDLDSIDEQTREHYANSKIVHMPDQYSNDFEKALWYLIEQKRTGSLVILGMHGKRADHMLTNLSVLVRMRDYFGDVRVIDENQEHALLTGAHNSIEMSHPKGTLVSLTPMPRAFGVTTHGLYYPISGSEMHFGQHEGLSNVIAASGGSKITIADGALLVSLPSATA